MTPPRGDNWAGAAGMTAGLLVYCYRARQYELARATLVSGFIGGIGFAAASMLKLVEVTCGYVTNWHSVLEQTTGLFNGIGLAVAMAGLARRTTPSEPGEAEPRPWTELLALGFVLVVIPYLNARKNVNQWIQQRAMPPMMSGVPAWVWFDLGYLALALTLLALWRRHRRQPLAVLPESPFARGQVFYLILLWMIVAFNFERIVVVFRSQRLITEGVLYLVALVSTVVLLFAPESHEIGAVEPRLAPPKRARSGLLALTALGVLAAAVSIAADWAIVRAIHGDRHAGYSRLHIRFGPRATTGPTDQR